MEEISQVFDDYLRGTFAYTALEMGSISVSINEMKRDLELTRQDD
jgi:hypothetical protein